MKSAHWLKLGCPQKFSCSFTTKLWVGTCMSLFLGAAHMLQQRNCDPLSSHGAGGCSPKVAINSNSFGAAPQNEVVQSVSPPPCPPFQAPLTENACAYCARAPWLG